MVGLIHGNVGITTEYNSPLGVQSSKEEPSAAEIKAMKRSGQVKCETCSTRMYQDGSNESDVSFKAPGHISPQSSASTVMAHEQQHVANAYQKAGSGNGQVVGATVSLKMATCPECGRSYVAGGQTNTAIKYNESTPYGTEAKSFDAANGAIGGIIDAAV